MERNCGGVTGSILSAAAGDQARAALGWMGVPSVTSLRRAMPTLTSTLTPLGLMRAPWEMTPWESTRKLMWMIWTRRLLRLTGWMRTSEAERMTQSRL